MASRTMYLKTKVVEKMANNIVISSIDDEMAEFFEDAEITEEETPDLCDWVNNLKTSY